MWRDGASTGAVVPSRVMSSEEIVKAALELPRSEREWVLQTIAASLKVELDPELVAEIRRREEAFRRGEPGLPGDEVFDELLAE